MHEPYTFPRFLKRNLFFFILVLIKCFVAVQREMEDGFPAFICSPVISISLFYFYWLAVHSWRPENKTPSYEPGITDDIDARKVLSEDPSPINLQQGDLSTYLLSSSCTIDVGITDGGLYSIDVKREHGSVHGDFEELCATTLYVARAMVNDDDVGERMADIILRSCENGHLSLTLTLSYLLKEYSIYLKDGEGISNGKFLSATMKLHKGGLKFVVNPIGFSKYGSDFAIHHELSSYLLIHRYIRNGDAMPKLTEHFVFVLQALASYYVSGKLTIFTQNEVCAGFVAAAFMDDLELTIGK